MEGGQFRFDVKGRGNAQRPGLRPASPSPLVPANIPDQRPAFGMARPIVRPWRLSSPGLNLIVIHPNQSEAENRFADCFYFKYLHNL